MEENTSINYLNRHLLLMTLSINIPLIIIGAPFWVNILAIVAIFATAWSGNVGISYIYRAIHNILLRPGLYIWALIVAVTGSQDLVAIGFYIVMICQAKNIIVNFIGEIIILSSLLK